MIYEEFLCIIECQKCYNKNNNQEEQNGNNQEDPKNY